MKCLNFKEEPFKIYGVPFFEQTKVLRRLPEDVADKVPALTSWNLNRRCPGARLCFKTNSSEFTVKITFEGMSVDPGMSIFACQSASVLIGERQNPRFAGLISPKNYDTLTFEGTIKKSSDMENITIFLPRNEVIKDIELYFEDDAKIEEPIPYIDKKPILYYGSSITEGGCSSTVPNSYNAIISNRLNIDYYNLGFSGSAKGELEIADYINTFEMSLFVYDYDYNAPNPEHLKATHEPFFKRIREKNPDLPVIMMSKPASIYYEEDKERREIIKTTYNNAIENGDKNVYFIDGETFFGETDRNICTMDTCHPNDLGMMRMANIIEPVIKKILDLN